MIQLSFPQSFRLYVATALLSLCRAANPIDRVLTINAVHLHERLDGSAYQVLRIFVQSVFFWAAFDVLLRCVFRGFARRFRKGARSTYGVRSEG
jgi:hypothetical protein